MKKNSPESKEDIVLRLLEARKHKILDQDTFNLMLNVLKFTNLEVRDVMVTYSHMHVININDSLENIVDFAMQTSHSRFPVVANDKDEVVGILHVKDLLTFFFKKEFFDLKKILRKVVYVPEGKSLSTLIKEFREIRNHLAVVVDEYGGVSGIVTLEDAIEEIFGEIEDEFDPDGSKENIAQISETMYQVNAATELEEFNNFFKTHFSIDEVNTVGGLILSLFGYMPKNGEKIEYHGFNFQVAKVDRRRILVLKVSKIENQFKE